MKKAPFHAAFVALLLATPVSAATLLTGNGGPNWAETVHNDHAAAAAAVTLRTKESGILVDLTSASLLSPNGNGFAKVAGPFASLTIDPRDVPGFTAIGFTLTPPKIGKVGIAGPDKRKKTRVDPALSFLLTATFADGRTQSFESGFAPNNKFDLIAAPGEVIASISLSNLLGRAGGQSVAYRFDDIRQISFDPAQHRWLETTANSVVPEPAAWAMMLGGFGLVGAAIRRRRRSAVHIS